MPFFSGEQLGPALKSMLAGPPPQPQYPTFQQGAPAQATDKDVQWRAGQQGVTPEAMAAAKNEGRDYEEQKRQQFRAAIDAVAGKPNPVPTYQPNAPQAAPDKSNPIPEYNALLPKKSTKR
jgi:hypothetical protein